MWTVHRHLNAEVVDLGMRMSSHTRAGLVCWPENDLRRHVRIAAQSFPFSTTTTSHGDWRMGKPNKKKKSGGGSGPASATGGDGASQSSSGFLGHTIQLALLLGAQPLLVAFALLYLPQGIFPRNAAAASEDGSAIPVAVPFIPLVLSRAHRLLNTPEGVERILKKGIQGIVLAQAWFASRIAWWWDLSVALEDGKRVKDVNKSRGGVFKQMELLTVSALNLPPTILLVFLALVLLGAPYESHHVSSLLLACYLSVVAIFPILHVLHGPRAERKKATEEDGDVAGAEKVTLAGMASFSKQELPAGSKTSIQSLLARPFTSQKPRDLILLIPAYSTLLGAAIGSAALSLDWNRAWQAWPLPCVLGALAGLTVGNAVAFAVYVAAS